ncbi:rod shape-determining protein MreC [Campylobacter canadensis]|uniref:Rod shape-determining protein MreC n=1 Tax=Campylobacter canadensis TaxID=449520 RepID=A0ABS7WTZ5_9BACT|nr:rod shape-determining protein MreC [Campylobacter canadensis]MBZ7987484.1 rod shape-determining protein MreC [Campylobacter canadensis]MBZ7994827.1 rod shape-determining protein MreC [Campylobacter canadensis]MBZ7996388.1 rod shape-determining protein MreC [Campylobacter canadensis]MBZ7998422.1 rod shape-determining protein MreC [Campylobacter canadensis]MBZ8000136.1 rod shape-determining protein MreC [Campylobacter canadensis]
MRNKLRVFLLATILFVVSYLFSTDIKSYILKINDTTLINIYTSADNIELFFKKYFQQAKSIEELSLKNKDLEHYKILYKDAKFKLDKITELNNLENYNVKVHLARILSYEKLGVYTRFWLDYKDIKDNVTYGLVYNDQVSGIMYKKDNRAYAISVNDSDCAFSVLANGYQAIARGSSSGLYLDYINKYADIKIGDSVYTSGLDNIFTSGIYVGKIVDIIEETGYKKAILDTNVKLLPHYFLFVIQLFDKSK